MITEEIKRSEICIWLALPRSSLVACRKILFENSLSLQELFSQIVVMMENNDPRIKSIIETAKTNRIANNKKQLVFTNSKAIYAALEQNSPLRKKE